MTVSETVIKSIEFGLILSLVTYFGVNQLSCHKGTQPIFGNITNSKKLIPLADSLHQLVDLTNESLLQP
jgi:hypothetical protein